MTIETLISWCNAMYVPDETSDFDITDARWILFFNEALNDLRGTLQLETSETTDIVADTNSYALPTDLDYVIQVQLGASGSRTVLSEVNVTNNIYSNEYYTYGGNIVLDTQSTAITDGLVVYYNKVHTAFTATSDTIEIEYPYIIGMFALARVEGADRMMNEEGKWYGVYQSEKAKLQSMQTAKLGDTDEGW